MANDGNVSQWVKLLQAGKMSAAQFEALVATTAKMNSTKATTCKVGEFSGHPVLQFTGNFAPFSLGVQKCKAILAHVSELKEFVESAGK